MRRRNSGAILPVFFLFSGLAFSVIKGGIKGKILDSLNNPIAEAAVTIISVDYPSQQYKLKTDKKGVFIQIGLEPGDYRLRCEKEGFQPKEELVKVPINETIEKTLTLNSVAAPMKVEEAPGKKELREANTLYQRGKYEEALAAYQEAAVRAPKDPIIQYNIGVTFMAMGKSNEAIAAFQRTLEIQPENVQALKNLGQIYGQMKNFAESVKFNSQAAKLSAVDPEIFYNLGVGQMNLGNLEAALAAFQDSIACDEKYADSHYQLGLIFLNQNKMTEALAAFEKFLQVAPEDHRAPNVKEIIKVIKKLPGPVQIL
jgi:tetratricopeptide (TPR) repeat protein